MDKGDSGIVIDDLPVFFAEDAAEEALPPKKEAWKILVVDDDRGVHDLTSMILRRLEFEDRGIELVSGYSGEDARVLMQQHSDAAILLLDVVMEHERAGLDVVQYVRDALKNRQVRIILRTGQPGQAPELEVVTRYDINDYRDKTELTQEKLITAVVSALRSFRDLRLMDRNRVGLEHVVEATGVLFGPRSDKKLVQEVLRRLHNILGFDSGAANDACSGFAAREEEGEWSIYAGIGRYESLLGQNVAACVSPRVQGMVTSALDSNRTFFEENRYIATFKGYNQATNFLFFEGNRDFTDLDGNLMQVFMSNVGLAFHSISLHQEILETQRDITITLGELIEARSSEFGSHVRRVVESARLLGQLMGLPEEEVEGLWLAAAMHDLGKVVMDDGLLQKKDPLEPDELARIRQHTTVGFQILKGSKRKAMRIGATVAHQHHERWDGKGYPQGLRGEEIHLYARIVALVDVFDALIHDRVYRKGWSRDEALSWINKSRGTLFEPALVDLFFKNLSEFLMIQDRIPDKGIRAL
ncbi:MAG: DUF3369 domain-containing protein [Magnetococcales bacterium]|nr:DUF3369 domain-containing protein [Magnetococcales bacterium]MBF0148592.1 DUF3369 domain-containing protein [Magnetococcales bacterium]MBF0172278.1 DUF3369 domain-containing protein [Magnetococcales bacterium]MBF0347321.1 DUF3369 domain-containing protein [Magnetococcales bacterium]MBF0629715.1 DUF3369 domain-containing protein [Magnetococcales bacterium]